MKKQHGAGIVSLEHRIFNRIKNALDKKGTTLVELVATFAILAIFVVAAGQLITSGMNVYYRIKGATYGRQVADTLMTKIAGEIAGAQTATTVEGGTESDEAKTQTLIVCGGKIEFYDRTGSHVYITTNVDNRIVIHYFPVMSENTADTPGEETFRFEAVDWTFDEAAYMGYNVKSLVFSRKGNTNIIEIELTVSSSRYGDYTMTRYVKCYNFISDTDLGRISVESKDFT